MGRQLIIVSTVDVALYQALCADWAGDDDVTMLLERRRGQRRQETRAPAIERRRIDRRQHPATEAYLAWRGGGAAARKSDVQSALSRGSASVVVRQRPIAKAERGTAPPAPIADARDEPRHDYLTLTAPANAVIALVILLGTLSGGFVGGLALWLFLAYEFASRGRTSNLRGTSAPNSLDRGVLARLTSSASRTASGGEHSGSRAVNR